MLAVVTNGCCVTIVSGLLEGTRVVSVARDTGGFDERGRGIVNWKYGCHVNSLRRITESFISSPRMCPTFGH